MSLESSYRLYEILCIADYSSPDEVKRAYKSLALKYHPDKNLADPSCVEKFREVRIAYEVLSNADKKKKYDISLKIHKAGAGTYGRPGADAEGRRAARFSARSATTARSTNPYMSHFDAEGTNINSDIYDELHRQQQRRTPSRSSGAPRTASSGATRARANAGASPSSSAYATGSSSAGGASGFGDGASAPAASQYTREQHETFRRRERERQTELRRQLEKERADLREKERQQKRREQAKQEEMLQQRWRQQQLAYAAAAGQAQAQAQGQAAPVRSARRTGGLRSPQNDYDTASGDDTAAYGRSSSSRMPDLSFNPNLVRVSSTSAGGMSGRTGRRSSTGTPRQATPVGQRTTSTVRRSGGVRTASGFRRDQSSENIPFSTIDSTPLRRARTPQGGQSGRSPATRAAHAASPGGTGTARSRSPASATPPAADSDIEFASEEEEEAGVATADRSTDDSPEVSRTHVGVPDDGAPLFSTAFPMRSGGSAAARRGSAGGRAPVGRTTVVGGKPQTTRRGSSLGSTSTLPYTPRTARQSISRSDRMDGTSAATARERVSTASARAGPSGTTPRSSVVRKDRMRPQDARGEEQEKELQRIMRARKQLARERELAEAAERADPRYYALQLELHASDEANERDQMFEKEEALAWRRLMRLFYKGVGELLYGGEIRRTLEEEQQLRDARQCEERSARALLFCQTAQLHDRAHLESLERRHRKQIAGKEATDLYYVQRSNKVKSALAAQESQLRRRIEHAHQVKSTYLFELMGPEFFARMRVVAEERAVRNALKQSAALAAPSSLSSSSPGGTATPLPSAQRDAAAEEAEGRASSADVSYAPNEVSFGSPLLLNASHPSLLNASAFSVLNGLDDADVPLSLVAELPPVLRCLALDERAERVELAAVADAAFVALLRRRSSALHGCYEAERLAAVSEAMTHAARETEYWKLRAAELERELRRWRSTAPSSAASSPRYSDGRDAAHPSASPPPLETPLGAARAEAGDVDEHSSRSGARDNSSAMRVCTPSTMSEQSDAGEAETEGEPSAGAHSGAARAANRSYAVSKMSSNASVNSAHSSSTVGVPARAVKYMSPPRSKRPRPDLVKAADGATGAAGVAPAAIPRTTIKPPPASMSTGAPRQPAAAAAVAVNDNGADDDVSVRGVRVPSANTSTAGQSAPATPAPGSPGGSATPPAAGEASTSPTRPGGLDLSRLFSRWRESPSKASPTPPAADS